MSSKKNSKSKIGTGSAKSAKMIAPVVTSAVTRKAKSPPVTVSMREEIGDLSLVEQFTNTPLLVMPTNETLFPWGHKIAKLYTTRKWLKLFIEYVPNTATSIGGTVMAAMQADPDKLPFTDDQELLNHQNAVNSAPYTGWKMDLLQKSNKVPVPEKFNATPEAIGLGLDLSEDLHTIADGVLNIAVKGLQSFFGTGVNVTKRQTADGKETVADVKSADPPTEVTTGKLYVDYTVVYNDPVMESIDGGFALFSQVDEGGRALVEGEPFITSAAIGAPVTNDIGVAIACDDTTGDGGPPNHVKRLGLKFATIGLYIVHVTWNSSDAVQSTGADIQLNNSTTVSSPGTSEWRVFKDGLQDAHSSSFTYKNGVDYFAILNVLSLTSEATSTLVGQLDCDYVLEMQTYSSGATWDDYVQSQCDVYVAKCGTNTLLVPGRMTRTPGGLQSRTMPRQLAWFERRQFAKAVQMKSMQAAIDREVNAKRQREAKQHAGPRPSPQRERVWPPGRSVVGVKDSSTARPVSAAAAAAGTGYVAITMPTNPASDRKQGATGSDVKLPSLVNMMSQLGAPSVRIAGASSSGGGDKVVIEDAVEIQKVLDKVWPEGTVINWGPDGTYTVSQPTKPPGAK